MIIQNGSVAPPVPSAVSPGGATGAAGQSG